MTRAWIFTCHPEGSTGIADFRYRRDGRTSAPGGKRCIRGNGYGVGEVNKTPSDDVLTKILWFAVALVLAVVTALICLGNSAPG